MNVADWEQVEAARIKMSMMGDGWTGNYQENGVAVVWEHTLANTCPKIYKRRT